MKNEYKNLLNEMIPNAERFGSRMDLARHQAQRVKKVIDAHNADVDFKSLKNQGASEVAPWHEKDLAGRAERIKRIAQAHGANLGFKGNPSTRQSVYSKAQPSEVKLAQLDYKGKPEVTVDFSRLSDEQRQEGQKKADELRKTGLADRKVKAKQEAQSREKARISNAFTFESMQIDETSKARRLGQTVGAILHGKDTPSDKLKKSTTRHFDKWWSKPENRKKFGRAVNTPAAAQAIKDLKHEYQVDEQTDKLRTQMYANILRETYRITPKRRELLNREEGQARQSVEDQLAGTTPMNQNDLMMNTSKMARIEAIRQMGLPQDVRTGRGQGLNDKQLKTVMGNARATQKTLEYLKRREAK